MSQFLSKNSLKAGQQMNFRLTEGETGKTAFTFQMFFKQ